MVNDSDCNNVHHCTLANCKVWREKIGKMIFIWIFVTISCCLLVDVLNARDTVTKFKNCQSQAWKDVRGHICNKYSCGIP